MNWSEDFASNRLFEYYYVAQYWNSPKMVSVSLIEIYFTENLGTLINSHKKKTVYFPVLAQTIWEAGSNKKNPSDFMDSFQQSDLAMFGFSDDFIIDLWGAISDAKGGRLNKPVVKDINEQF